jgi:hypothetical protein
MFRVDQNPKSAMSYKTSNQILEVEMIDQNDDITVIQIFDLMAENFIFKIESVTLSYERKSIFKTVFRGENFLQRVTRGMDLLEYTRTVIYDIITR